METMTFAEMRELIGDEERGAIVFEGEISDIRVDSGLGMIPVGRIANWVSEPEPEKVERGRISQLHNGTDTTAYTWSPQILADFIKSSSIPDKAKEPGTEEMARAGLDTVPREWSPRDIHNYIFGVIKRHWEVGHTQPHSHTISIG